MDLTESELARFWKNVNISDDCWEWGSTERLGYRQMRVSGKHLYVHRISFFLYHGYIDESLMVRHTCDNPRCVKPAHLVQGSAKLNSDDKMERNRHNYKFSNEEVEEMRKLPMTPTVCRELAESTGSSVSAIRRMLNGEQYEWVPGAVEVPRQHTAHSLTPEEVQEILTALESGTWGINRRLAQKYGVKEATISHIKKGRLKYSNNTQ